MVLVQRSAAVLALDEEMRAVELFEQRPRSRLPRGGFGHRRRHVGQERGAEEKGAQRRRGAAKGLDREVVEHRRRRHAARPREREALRVRACEQHDPGGPAARELVQRIQPAIRGDPARRGERAGLGAREAQVRKADRGELRAGEPACELGRRLGPAGDRDEHSRRRRCEQGIDRVVDERRRLELLVVVQNDDERRFDARKHGLEEPSGEHADRNAAALAERRKIDCAESVPRGGREPIEERRRIGVARIDGIPETGQTAGLDPGREERGLAGAGRRRDPDHLAGARRVEHREQALALEQLARRGPGELRGRGRFALHISYVSTRAGAPPRP